MNKASYYQQFLSLLVLLFVAVQGSAQNDSCQIDFSPDTIQIQCGDTAFLEPIDGSSQFSEGFNNQQLGPDWCSNQPVNFTNPCDPSMDGTPYAWMGPVANQPRELITEQIDVSCGGQICFDFDMAEQSNSAPCEGPDLSGEGVHLQWSIDAGPGCSGTWTDIFYFDPEACAGGGTGCGGGPGAAYVNWDNYCFNVPPAAQTDTTRFRFYQNSGSGPDFDHWGIDNVEITGSSCGQISQYSYDGANFDTTPDTTFTPTTNTDYTVWAYTDTSGGATPDTCQASVHVNVVGVPDLNVNADQNVIGCKDTTTLHADHNTAGNLTYEWTPNYSLSDPTVQHPKTWTYVDTTYTVISHPPGQPQCADTGTVSIENTCDTCFAPEPTLYQPTCNGDTDGTIIAHIYGPRPPFDLTWLDGSGNVIQQTSGVTSQYDTLSNITAGEYTILAEDTMGCMNDTVVNLGQPEPIKAHASGDTTICRGGGVAELEVYGTGGNAPPYEYDWNGGIYDSSHTEASPEEDVNYLVRAIDSLNCFSPYDTVSVNVHPPIDVETMRDDSICPGTSTELSISYVDGGIGDGYTYKWTNILGDTVGYERNVTITPENTMDYVVHTKDGCESPVARDTVRITHYSGPGPEIMANDREGCYPHNVEFNTLAQSDEVQSTFWSFGDGQISNETGSAQHTYTEPGCYDVTLELTTRDGCRKDTTYEDFICVRDYPTSDFEMRPERADVMNPTILFKDRSLGAEEYGWHFEHLDSSFTKATVEMNFPNDAPGKFTVEHWVSNQYGCRDTVAKTAIVEGVHNLFVPNAFTPNGDGRNDVFKPQGEGISDKDYTLTIFDRWGQVVFQTNNPDKGWDGTKDGEPLPEDVYVWRLEVQDAYQGSNFVKEGQVNLLR